MQTALTEPVTTILKNKLAAGKQFSPLQVIKELQSQNVDIYQGLKDVKMR